MANLVGIFMDFNKTRCSNCGKENDDAIRIGSNDKYLSKDTDIVLCRECAKLVGSDILITLGALEYEY